MRKSAIWIFLPLLLASTFTQAAPDGGEPASLQALIREALERNPGLEAALQRVRAAEAAIPRAGALPDPRLTLGLMNLPLDSFSFSQEPMTGKMVSVMQRFPFPGKQALASDMAELTAAAARHRQDEARLQLINMVKQAYFGIYAIDRGLDTVRRNHASMQQFVSAAEAKYAAGQGLQQDVLRAHLELTRLEDDLVMWEEKRRGAAARLNALLAREPEAPITVPADELGAPLPPPPAPTVEALEETRPLLRAWREKIVRAEAAVKLSRRGRWPDFTLGASYSQRGTLRNGAALPDFFSATVSFDLPIFSKRKQKVDIAVKRRDLAALKSEYAGLIDGIRSEIESLRARIDRSRQRIRLYADGILLQARQSLDSAHAGYRVGKVDFLTLINNWMMLRKDELQYHIALADYHKNLAGYELAIGAGSETDPDRAPEHKLQEKES